MNIVSQEYRVLLDGLKKSVSTSQYKAALSVNKELIILYHHIGTSILKSQEQHGWGAKIIDQLSAEREKSQNGNDQHKEIRVAVKKVQADFRRM